MYRCWSIYRKQITLQPPWLGWLLWNICVTNDHEYVPLVSNCRSFRHSWLITGFVTRLTRRVPPADHELLTLPEHLSSPPVFSGVRVTRYLVLYVCFIDRCLSFCPFSFGHCVIYSSSIYGFWLPLWYLQILLTATLHSRISGRPIVQVRLFLTKPSSPLDIAQMSVWPVCLCVIRQGNCLFDNG